MERLIKEPQILYNSRGKKSHVVLSIKTYNKLLERLEDIEDLKAIKLVENEKTVPWQVIKKRLRKKS